VKRPVMIRSGALILVLVIAAPDAFAQQTTTIRGRVFAAGNKQPLRRALVSFPARQPQNPALPPQGPSGVLTDDEGRFEIAIGDGVTTLVASKGGYAPASVELLRQAVTPRTQ